MARDYLACYFSTLEAVEELTDEECGRLFKAMMSYARDGIAPSLAGNERFVFPSIRVRIDADRDAYEMKCQALRENASKSHKNTQAKKRKQKAEPATKPVALYDETTELGKMISEFIKYRAEIRSPFTEYAMNLFLKKLDSLGHTDAERIEIIKQSIENGWKGIFPLRNNGRTARRTESNYIRNDITDDDIAAILANNSEV